MKKIPRGLLKHGILYYLGVLASFLALLKIPFNIHLLLIIVIIAVGAYGAYLNYYLGRKVWAIILGCIAVFFLPCIGFSNQAAWKLYYLIAGLVFAFFLVSTLIAIIKRASQ